MNKNKIHIIMCGSDLSVGGGIVSVVKNYIDYNDWGDIDIEYISTHINGSVQKKIIYFIKGYLKIIKRLLMDNVDIFHLHLCDGGPFYRKTIILYTAKFFKKQVVLHHHTDYTMFFSKLKGIKKFIVRCALKKADINIVLGINLVDVIKKFEKSSKVIPIYNAVKIPERYCYNPNGKTIMFMGWLIERKGLYDFLNAIKKIDKLIDAKYKVALCGDGGEDIYEKIKCIGIAHRIAHIGWIDGAKKNRFLSDTIVNVLPSYREGLPMTILETMAYGIPNIASNISTIPEIIKDGYSGFLIEPGDVNGIAKYIIQLVNDTELRINISKAAFDTIEKCFTIDIHVKKIMEIYKLLCGETNLSLKIY